MYSSKGRMMKVEKDSTVIAGCQSRGISFTNEAGDITDGEANGFTTFSSVAGVRNFEISVEGWTASDVLRNIAADPDESNLLTDVTITFAPTASADATGAEITGDVYLSAYEESGGDADEVAFTATFASSGEWQFTAEVSA